MKPYYSQDGITLWCADCREVIPQLEPVDLVLTDPPYNAGIRYGPSVEDLQSWPSYCEWLAPIIEQCEAVSGGLVLVFLSVNGLLYLSGVKRPRHVCVWDKPMSFSPRLGGSAFLPHWEPCAVYGKPWGEGGRVPDYHLSDVWHHNTAERNGHPCPKPLPLLLRILRDIPAEVVLDPFAGSGTTLVAAKQLGRKAIGIEIEERYCEIAAKRLSQEVFQFEPPPETPEQMELPR